MPGYPLRLRVAGPGFLKPSAVSKTLSRKPFEDLRLFRFRVLRLGLDIPF